MIKYIYIYTTLLTCLPLSFRTTEATGISLQYPTSASPQLRLTCTRRTSPMTTTATTSTFTSVRGARWTLASSCCRFTVAVAASAVARRRSAAGTAWPSPSRTSRASTSSSSRRASTRATARAAARPAITPPIITPYCRASSGRRTGGRRRGHAARPASSPSSRFSTSTRTTLPSSRSPIGRTCVSSSALAPERVIMRERERE